MTNRQRSRLATWTTMAGVLAALACGLAIRSYQAWTTSVIARDGIGYVNMARSMRDNWRAGIPEVVQFGYPLLIKWAYPLVGPHVAGDDLMRWQRTAQVVSVVCGSLCIPAVYWLGRRLLSRRVGMLAAWGWALLPDAVRFSADALSDMPCLMLMLWGLIAAMVALRRRSIEYFVWAGVLSGAAYAIREEGGEIAFVATLLALTRGRVSLFWRATACMAVIAGFAVFGGSYIWIEGGYIVSEKPYLQVRQLLEPCRALLATWPGQPSHAPMLASVDNRTFTEQARDLLQRPWGAAAWQAAVSLHQLLLEMGNSLNGVWLVLGLAYLFLPGRRRFRRGWRRLPALLVVLHTIILLLLYAKCGYLARRHVMLLNVWMMILAAGTLTWIAQQITSRLTRAGRLVPSWQMGMARRADVLILMVIVLGTLPWLLRDVGEDRWHVHDAARWIQDQYPGRSDVRIVCQHPWIPFYARQTRWDLVDSSTQTCPQLTDAELLVLEGKSTPPPSTVEALGTKSRVQLMMAKEFPSARGHRTAAIYRVGRLPATTAPGK